MFVCSVFVCFCFVVSLRFVLFFFVVVVFLFVYRLLVFLCFVFSSFFVVFLCFILFLQVFVLAASNIPWDLDPAILRRLEKRIHVHLPTVDAREQMFRKNLVEVVDESTINFRHLALKTEGYSGADIDIVCREAAMRTLRSKMAKLEQDLDDKQLQKELVGLDKVMSVKRKSLIFFGAGRMHFFFWRKSRVEKNLQI